jgi:hypothetical protein
MERLDQGHLHLSIMPPETEMSRLGIEPLIYCTACRRSTKELLQQLTQSTIWKLYNLNKWITSQRLCFASGVNIYILKMSNYVKAELFGLVCPLFL